MAPFSWSRWLRSKLRPQVQAFRKLRPAPLHMEQLETRLAPATFVWSGQGGNAFWSTAKNWAGGVAPTGQLDDLVFGPGVASTSTTNDLTAPGGGTPLLDSITISASNYTLGGNAIQLAPSGATGSQASGSITVVAGAAKELVNFNVQLTGPAGSREFVTVGQGADLTIKGQLSGNSGTALTKEGSGTLILTGDNSGFSGPFKIDDSAGIVQVQNSKALGDFSVTNIVTVGQNAQLQLNDIGGKGLTFNQFLILNSPGVSNRGALLNVLGNNTWAGSIEVDSSIYLGSDDPAAATDALTITGQISDQSGAHDITKVGVGTIVFAHVGGNNYHGQTIINNGLLEITDPLALGAADGSAATGTVVNSNLTGSGTLAIKFVALDPSDPNAILQDPTKPFDAKTNPVVGFQVPNELLTLNGPGFFTTLPSFLTGGKAANVGAVLNYNGHNAWTGNVILGSGPPNGSGVTMGAQDSTILTVSGVVQDPAGNTVYPLTKDGLGTVIFTSANTYAGLTTIANGTLEIDDSQGLGSTAAGTNVLNGGTLALSVDNLSDSVTGNTSGLYVTEPLNITGFGSANVGALRSAGGINVYAGTITLSGKDAAIGVQPDPNTTPSAGYFPTYDPVTHFATGGDASLTILNNGTTGGIVGPTSLVLPMGTTLHKVGTGQLVLPTANPYFGATKIDAGWVTVEDSGALGQRITGLGNTVEPAVSVNTGAALHLNAVNGPLNITKNLVLAGSGFSHSFGLISNQGALENINGINTVSGDISLQGQVGIGVENIFGASDLTLTGSTNESVKAASITIPGTASGSTAENDNVIDTGSNSGTVSVNYNMFFVPDSMNIYYGVYPGATLALIATTGGPVSGTGTLVASYGPGPSTFITIVMNQGGGITGTVWTYTATVTPNSTFLGAGGITKLGSQKLNVQGDGSYTGPVDIKAGVLRNQNDTGLGAGTAKTSTTTVEAGQATVQSLTLTNAQAGTTQFTLSLGGQTTAPITYQGTAADVTNIQAALNGLSSVTMLGGKVTVAQAMTPGGNGVPPQPIAGEYLVTFGGGMAALDESMTAAITGGTGLETIAVVTQTHGAGAALELAQTIPQDAGGLTRGVQVSGEQLIINGQGDPAFGDAPLTVLNGDHQWRGGVTLDVASTVQVAPNSRLSFLGTIDDAANTSASGSDLTLTGGGEVDLLGNNTYRGTTVVGTPTSPAVLVINNAQALGSTGVAEVQTITFTGALPSTTTFTLTFNGQTTAPLPYTGTGTDALTIQGALNALSSVASTGGSVSVTGSGGVYTVTFGSNLFGFKQSLLAAAITAGPGTTKVAVTEVTAGAGGTVVANGSSLQLEGNLSLAAEPLVIQGQGVATTPNLAPQWFQVGPAPLIGEKNGVVPTLAPQNASGRVTAVVVDPTDSNVIYIGTAGGGAWKTKDGGKTWHPLFDSASYPLANIPPSMFIGAIALAPSDPRVIYLGTGEAVTSLSVVQLGLPAYYGTGVYKSTDAGQTWTLLQGTGNLQNPLYGQAVSRIVVDNANVNLIYAATSDQATNALQLQAPGIWRYNGTTWTNTTAVISSNRATQKGKLAAPPNSPGPDDDFRIVFPSRNATWSDLGLSSAGVLYAALGTAEGDINNAVFYSLNPSSPQIVWNVGDGALDSETSGEFPAGPFPNGPAINGNIKLAIDPTAPKIFGATTIYASIATPVFSGSGLREIVVSTNGGVTWAAVKAQPPNYLGGQGFYDSTIVATDANTVYVGGQGYPDHVFRTLDGGATWASVSVDGANNSPHTDDHAMAIIGTGANAKVVLGSDGGVWEYDPAGTTQQWFDINGNLATIQFNGIAVDPNNPSVAYGGSQDNGTEGTTGNPGWNFLDVGDGGQANVDPLRPNVIFHVLNGTLRKSIDFGQTWTTVLNTFSLYFPFLVDPLYNSPAGARLLAGDASSQGIGFGGLQESIDGGTTWISLNAPIDPTGIGISGFQGAFVPDPSFPQVTDKLANTYDPDTIYITDGARVFVTKNHGTTWVNRTPTTFSSFLSNISIFVDPGNRDHAFVVNTSPRNDPNGPTPVTPRILETHDGGQSWQDITANLPQVATWTVQVDPRNGNVYVGNDVGVYVSQGSGSTWTRFGAGLPDVKVTQLVLNQALNTLSAGTYGRSMFQLFLSDVRANSGALTAQSGNVVWSGPIQLVGAPGTNAVSIGANGSQVVQNGVTAAKLTIVGTISDQTAGGNATLFKVGGGDVVLQGSNTYGGVTEIKQGNLVVHNPMALGSPANGTIVDSGTALELQTDLNAETVFLNGDGIQPGFNGHNTGALRNLSGNNTFTGTLVLQSSSTVGVDSGTRLTISGTGTIKDNGSGFTLTKESPGTLVLATANSYGTGNTAAASTTVSQGVLSVQNAHALGVDGNLTSVVAGAQLQVQAPPGSSGITIANQTVALAGSGILGTGALEGVGGANDWAGNVQLNGSPAIGVLSVSPSDSLTIDGVISGPISGFTKVGNGPLILTNSNTYGGATNVAAGTIDVRNGGALGTPGTSAVQLVTVSGTGGTFTLSFNGAATGALPFGASANQVAAALNGLSTIGGVGASVNVSLAGGTYTVTFNGSLGGGNPPALTGTGSGGVIVAITTNGTTVQPGAGLILNGDPLGLGFNLTVAGEGLVLNGTGPAAVQTVAVTGTTGTFALTFNGQTSSQLPFNATASQVQFALNAIVGAGASVSVTEPAPGLFVVTFGGSLAGTAVPALTATGIGGAGATITVVTGGGAGALHNATGNNAWTGPVTLQTSSSLGADAGTNLTVSGVIQDPQPSQSPASTLTKVGQGTVTLPSANTYAGPTLVSQGILNIQNAGALGAVVSEVETIGLSGPTTGSFTLTFNGKTTGTIPATATAAVVQAQLNALPNIGGVGGSVSVSRTGSTFTVTFGGTLAGQHLTPLTASGSGGTVVAVKVIQDGSWGTTVSPGATLQLQGGITVSTEALTISGQGAAVAQVQTVTVSGDLTGTFTLTFNGQTTAALSASASAGQVAAALNALSTIGGVGGTAVVTLAAPSTYAVTFAGTLAGQNLPAMTGQGFPGTSGATSVSVAITTAANPTLGALDSASGANTWDATLTLAGNASIGADTDASNTVATLTIDQPIVETSKSSLTKYGTGVAVFSGSTNNTYTGLTTVADGTLQLNKSSGFAVPGNLTVGDSTFGVFETDVLQLLASEQINPASSVIVNSDGLFDLNGQTQTVGFLGINGGAVTLTGAGSLLKLGGNVVATSAGLSNGTSHPATISGDGDLLLNGATRTFTVNGAPTSASTPDLIISALIVGNTGDGLTKAGSGTLQLTKDESYTGLTTVTGGELLADGNPASLTVHDVSLNGGTLGGLGLVGKITSAAGGGGVLAGDSFLVPGTLTANGDVTWNAKTTFSVPLYASTSPLPSGLLLVNGNASLGGAGLAGFVDPAVQVGDSFVILQTTGGGHITGKFAEPASNPGVAFIGGEKFQVAYLDSLGNPSSNPTQVVLTRALNKATVSAASSANPSVFGQDVMFTATVTPESGAAAIPGTDTVTFYLDNDQVGDTVVLVGGKATFDPLKYFGQPLSVGSHTLDIQFNGDGNYAPSRLSDSGNLGHTFLQTVNRATTAIGVTASPPNPVPGQPVILTATITPVAPATGTPIGPGGSATFTIDNVAYSGGPVTLNAAGQAIVTLPSLTVGTHRVRVSYSGDNNFKPVSTIQDVLVTVSKGVAVVGVTAVPASSVFGQAVTFTATVSGPVAPTGTVTFYNGAAVQANNLGTFGLDSNGLAQVTVSNLSAGPHNITAVYSGNTSYVQSNGSLAFTVNQAGTQTSLTSSANPAQFGQTVKLTATVSTLAPAVGTAAGSVTFRDGTTILATVPLNAAGAASLTVNTLGVGGHTLTATYNGSTNFASSSASLTQGIQDGTLVTLSSSGASVFGQAVTITATLRAAPPASGMPPAGETVTFYEGSIAGGNVIGTGTLDASGKAQLTISTLGVGTHQINVKYDGDGTFLAGSNASPLLQVVNKDGTTTTLSASPTSINFGQTVTLTATVTARPPGAGIPTGTVTFYDGAITPARAIGSAVLDPTATATLQTSALSGGTHTILAAYNDDANFLSSQSAVSGVTVTVAKDGTTTTVSASLGSTVFGQSVTFTAIVTPVVPVNFVPSGTVTFYDGAVLPGNILKNGTVSVDKNGVASLVTTALGVGTHHVTAVYGGDASFGASQSSTAATVSVAQDATATALTTSVNPLTFGQTVKLTATVTANAPGSGVPTGTVTFFDGATPLPNSTTPLDAGGVANFFTASLPVGSHSLTAVYNGSASYITSTSNAVNEAVQIGGTLTVGASLLAAVYGQPVTLTATFKATPPGTGVPGTGEIATFYLGPIANNKVLGTGTFDATGKATLTTSLPVGTDDINAAYAGNATFLPIKSTSPVTVTVSKDATTTTVTTSGPSVFGQSATFTATVTANPPGSGTPAGTVNFYDGSVSAQNLLGSATLDGSGKATFSTSALTGGTHTVIAAYAGNANFQGGQGSVSQSVSKASTTTTVVPSVSTAVYSQPVTFTATVSSAAGTPTGTVSFYEGSVAPGNLLGFGTLDNNGNATFSTNALTVGSHSIVAAYNADTNFGGSQSAVPAGVTVSQDSTSTAVTSSANPSVFGQPVTFTATVAATAPGTGTPSGTVTFFDGSTNLGTVGLNGGKAVLQVPGLAFGPHSITAQYNATTNFGGSTSPVLLQQVLDASSITVAASPPSVYGQAVTLTATVKAVPPGPGVLPTGTVNFYDGAVVPANLIGTATVNQASGLASISFSGLTAGTHSINAMYSGDSTFVPSQTATPATQVVNKDATTTTVSPSASSTTYGQAVIFTATVTANPPGGGTPTGRVEFYDGAVTASHLLGRAILSGGTATFSYAALTAGPHNVTAVYLDDANFLGSQSATAASVLVGKSATTTTAADGSGVYGQAVPIAVTVATVTGGGTPTGLVGLYRMTGNGLKLLGKGALNGSGVATVIVNGLAVGTYSLVAYYGGDSNTFGSNSAGSPATLTIGQDATNISLVSNMPTSITGQPVTFTATVGAAAPGSGLPTGTVTFFDNNNPFATVPVVNGHAVLTTAGLALGAHSISAVYNGDGNFLASNPATAIQEVVQSPVAIGLKARLVPGAKSPKAGVPFSVQVFAIDALGRPVVGFNATATMSFVKGPFGGTLIGTPTANIVDGQGVFNDNVVVTLGGGYQVRIVAGGFSILFDFSTQGRQT